MSTALPASSHASTSDALNFHQNGSKVATRVQQSKLKERTVPRDRLDFPDTFIFREQDIDRRYVKKNENTPAHAIHPAARTDHLLIRSEHRFIRLDRGAEPREDGDKVGERFGEDLRLADGNAGV